MRKVTLTLTLVLLTVFVLSNQGWSDPYLNLPAGTTSTAKFVNPGTLGPSYWDITLSTQRHKSSTSYRIA